MPDLCKIGEVFFTVTSEEVINYSNEVTERNVEDGSNVADNIKNKPVEIDVKGKIFGTKDYPHDQIRKLRMYQIDKKVLCYYGAYGFYSNMVIESFPNTHNKELANGISFELKLKQVRITNKQTVSINTSKFTIPDIEKMKEQIQDTKQDKKDAKREAKQAAKKSTKAKAKTKAKKKTSKGRQAKKATKGKKSMLQKIRNRF